MASVAGVCARGGAGIRLVDVALTAVVAGAVELFVAAASGPGQHPLDAQAYLVGAVLALPVLFRRRRPLGVLISCTLLLVVYYAVDRRNIPPTPLISLPVYDATVAGFLPWALAVPGFFVTAGLFVLEARPHHGAVTLAAEFMPRLAGVPVVLWLLPAMIFPLAVLLGALARGRRALAAETARRLRLAEDEREAEAARRVAEERLRIARELHDTVAHCMATITVQAGSALHLLDGDGRDASVRDALAAIRWASKSALSEMRATLGQLRQPSSAERNPRQAGPGTATGGTAEPAGSGAGRIAGNGPGSAGSTPGLARLPSLRDAVTAAGLPVTVAIEGTQVPVPGQVDHAAYRILQESLTNVLRHAGPGASSAVRICYGTAALTLEVTDDGAGPGSDRGPSARRGGHGLAGMTERATAIGGELAAGPRPGGGFAVRARLPI
jgi:signal transduction histidine kinase